MQFIAYLNGNPAVSGWHRRDFKWNAEFGCYVYLDRTFDEKEFNTVMPAIWKKYREQFPQFKIVGGIDAAPAPQKPVEPVPPIDLPVLPAEITIEQAEAALMKLAPEKLRSRPGKPSAVTPVKAVA